MSLRRKPQLSRQRRAQQQELRKQRPKRRSTFSPIDLRPRLLQPVQRPRSNRDPWRISSLTGMAERRAHRNQQVSQLKAAQPPEG